MTKPIRGEQSEVAVSMGFHYNLFTHLKKNDPTIFRYIKIYGKGNLHQGLSVYLEQCQRDKDEIADIYYKLVTCRALSKFYEANKDTLPYSSARSFSSSIVNNAFTPMAEGVLLRGHAVRSMKAVIKAFKRGKGLTDKDLRVIEELFEGVKL